LEKLTAIGTRAARQCCSSKGEPGRTRLSRSDLDFEGARGLGLGKVAPGSGYSWRENGDSELTRPEP
jgi:hypothetical protein